MYTPKHFRNDDIESLKTFIRQNNFGVLVSEVNSRPWATHIPFILNDEGSKLTTHIAKGNLQWKHLNSDKEVMIIFQGPHAYVSSSWYDHENVPTWNYLAVHVYGKSRLIEGEELKEALRQLVNHHEKELSNPVSVDRMTPSYLATEMRGIVGFEIKITEIQASYKLSQNRDNKNYESIIHHLEAQNYPEATAIAREMRNLQRD